MANRLLMIWNINAQRLFLTYWEYFNIYYSSVPEQFKILYQILESNLKEKHAL